MMRPAAGLTVALFLLSAGVADAHTVIDGVSGFQGGLVHPLLVPAHMLVLLALGCLTGQIGAASRWLAIAVFAAAAVASVLLVTLAFSAVNAELLVLVLGALSGLLLASGWCVSLTIILVLAVCIAAAIVFDSVPAVLSVQETILSLAGTSIAATAIVTVVALASAAGPQLWQRIGVRILGSWIAASAIIVLALRLSR